MTSTCPVTAFCVRLLHCVRLCDSYMQMIQHTYMHKAATRYAEANKLVSHRRQSNYSIQLHCVVVLHVVAVGLNSLYGLQ